MYEAQRHKTVIKLLFDVDFDADLIYRDSQDQTILSYTAQCWLEGAAESLADVDPNFRESQGQRPLSWAVRQGHVTMVDQLLDVGHDVDSKFRNYACHSLAMGKWLSKCSSGLKSRKLVSLTHWPLHCDYTYAYPTKRSPRLGNEFIQKPNTRERIAIRHIRKRPRFSRSERERHLKKEIENRSCSHSSHVGRPKKTTPYRIRRRCLNDTVRTHRALFPLNLPFGRFGFFVSYPKTDGVGRRVRWTLADEKMVRWPGRITRAPRVQNMSSLATEGTENHPLLFSVILRGA